MDPAEELVEVVDESGAVERIVTRAEMRAGILRHRSTYIAVRRSSGALVVHRRADWKDVNPGIWDIAFGGVVGVGEGWAESARRELAEEAGLTNVELTPLGLGTYDAADGRIVAHTFLVETDEPINCPDGEVVEVDETLDLAGWLQNHQVCADSVAVLAGKGLGLPLGG